MPTGPEQPNQGAPNQGEIKAPDDGAVLTRDPNQKGPATNAGSSSLEGGVLTKQPGDGKKDEGSGDPVDNRLGTDGQDPVGDDDVETKNLGSYTLDTIPERKSFVKRAAVGTVAAIVTLGAIFGIGSKVAGSGDEKPNEDRTEEVSDFPGQPDTTQPEEPDAPEELTSDDPYTAPGGYAIEFSNKPTSLGGIQVVRSPEAEAAVQQNADLAKFGNDSKDATEALIQSDGQGDILVGCVTFPESYRTSDGSIVNAQRILALPSTQTREQGDKTQQAFQAFEEDLGYGGDVVVEMEGDQVTRVAYGFEDVQVIPIDPSRPTAKVAYKSSWKPSDVPGQKGELGVVASLADSPEKAFMVARPILLMGEPTQEQIEATCKQQVANTGFDISLFA